MSQKFEKGKTRKKGKGRVRASILKNTLLVIKAIELQRRMCHSACREGKQQLFGIAILHLTETNVLVLLQKKLLFFIYWKFIVFFAKMPVSRKMTIFICTIFLNGWEVKQPLLVSWALCVSYTQIRFILKNVPKRVRKNIREKNNKGM